MSGEGAPNNRIVPCQECRAPFVIEPGDPLFCPSCVDKPDVIDSKLNETELRLRGVEGQLKAAQRQIGSALATVQKLIDS